LLGCRSFLKIPLRRLGLWRLGTLYFASVVTKEKHLVYTLMTFSVLPIDLFHCSWFIHICYESFPVKNALRRLDFLICDNLNICQLNIFTRIYASKFYCLIIVHKVNMFGMSWELMKSRNINNAIFFSFLKIVLRRLH
jgi:hypothetical protein